MNEKEIAIVAEVFGMNGGEDFAYGISVDTYGRVDVQIRDLKTDAFRCAFDYPRGSLMQNVHDISAEMLRERAKHYSEEEYKLLEMLR